MTPHMPLPGGSQPDNTKREPGEGIKPFAKVKFSDGLGLTYVVVSVHGDIALVVPADTKTRATNIGNLKVVD